MVATTPEGVSAAREEDFCQTMRRPQVICLYEVTGAKSPRKRRGLRRNTKPRAKKLRRGVNSPKDVYYDRGNSHSLYPWVQCLCRPKR